MELNFEVHHICGEMKDYVLSFDDEPSQNTGIILDKLKKHNIKANFFINTNKLLSKNSSSKVNIRRVQRMLDEGHEVNNHTVSHKDLTSVSADKVRSEIIGAYKTLHDFFPEAGDNLRADIVRPPFGYLNNDVYEAIKDEPIEYKFVRWNADRYDWQNTRTSDEVISRLKQQLSFIEKNKKENTGFNSSFFDLNHGWSQPTLSSLDEMIKIIKSKNYEFVSTSKCIQK